MDIRIKPGLLRGSVNAVSSKSDAHRALICAALYAEGSCTIELSSSSADIEATVDVLKALGAGISKKGFSYVVEPVRAPRSGCVLDCAESGSTLRFMIPVASALADEVSFTGKGRLPQRPLTDLCNALKSNGCEVSGSTLPLTVKNKLKKGSFVFPGNVSSQYISGMLFALPLLEKGSSVVLSSPLESSAYVDMTCKTLERFGITFEQTENSWKVKDKIDKGLAKYCVEGDWSNSAFWLCSNFLGSEITVNNLSADSAQGDRKIQKILSEFGSASDVYVDCREIPDLVPALAVAACGRKSRTFFTDCGRLRLKESDRIESVCSLIKSLGGIAESSMTSITVTGCGTLKGGIVDGMNDHRIVMAGAAASSICTDDVVIKGAQAVNKSYPTFFDDFSNLKGECSVISIR